MRWIRALCVACLLVGLSGGAMAQLPGELTTVIIDPGHGGKDPGTHGAIRKEKDIVLAVALKLGQYLQKEFPRLKVRYTRNTDTFIALNERSERAIAEKADLFISIHCNWASSPATEGAESYVMGLHRSNSNLEVAQRENAVIAYEDDYTTKYEGYDPKSPESFMIFSLIQNVFLDQSLEFASMVQDEFATRAKRTNRGVRQAGFLVLYKSTMPAVLIELGFLSNAKEERFLASAEGQDYMASAILRAFRRYKKARDLRSLPSMVAISRNDADADTTRAAGSQSSAPAASSTTSTPPAQSAVRYRVQVATLNKAVERSHRIWKEFPDLIEEKAEGQYRYYTGEYTSYEAAKQVLEAALPRHKGAFIVALRNGKRISTEQARKSNP